MLGHRDGWTWKFLVVFVPVLISLSSDAAFAADEWETKKTDSGTVKFKKKTVYEFSGSNLEGKLKSPSGALISPPQKVKVNRLIKLRTDFDSDVQNSASGAR